MTELLKQLEIIHPDGTNQVVNLRDTAIKIGRAAGNDIVLSDDRVSQWHCIIIPSEEGYWSIRDGVIGKGSTNGTLLKRNNQVIDIGKLSDCKEFLSGDDEIQIQKWRIIFRDPFKTNRGNSTNTGQNNSTESNQNGYVFCISQMKLYAINGANRQEVNGLRPKVIDLLTCLARENLINGKPVLCTYENIAQFIWGSSDYHGAEEIQGLARELRKIIDAEGLETIKSKGYILKIGYEE